MTYVLFTTKFWVYGDVFVTYIFIHRELSCFEIMFTCCETTCTFMHRAIQVFFHLVSLKLYVCRFETFSIMIFLCFIFLITILEYFRWFSLNTNTFTKETHVYKYVFNNLLNNIFLFLSLWINVEWWTEN